MKLNKTELNSVENALVVYNFTIKSRLKEVKKNISVYNKDYIVFLENEYLATKILLKKCIKCLEGY